LVEGVDGGVDGFHQHRGTAAEETSEQLNRPDSHIAGQSGIYIDLRDGIDMWRAPGLTLPHASLLFAGQSLHP